MRITYALAGHQNRPDRKISTIGLFRYNPNTGRHECVVETEKDFFETTTLRIAEAGKNADTLAYITGISLPVGQMLESIPMEELQGEVYRRQQAQVRDFFRCDPFPPALAIRYAELISAKVGHPVDPEKMAGIHLIQEKVDANTYGFGFAIYVDGHMARQAVIVPGDQDVQMKASEALIDYFHNPDERLVVGEELRGRELPLITDPEGNVSILPMAEQITVMPDVHAGLHPATLRKIARDEGVDITGLSTREELLGAIKYARNSKDALGV